MLCKKYNVLEKYKWYITNVIMMKRAEKQDITWFRKYGNSIHWYIINCDEFAADDFCIVMLNFEP